MAQCLEVQTSCKASRRLCADVGILTMEKRQWNGWKTERNEQSRNLTCTYINRVSCGRIFCGLHSLRAMNKETVIARSRIHQNRVFQDYSQVTRASTRAPAGLHGRPVLVLETANRAVGRCRMAYCAVGVDMVPLCPDAQAWATRLRRKVKLEQRPRSEILQRHWMDCRAQSGKSLREVYGDRAES